MRLALRLILALTAIVVVIESALSYLNVEAQERDVLDQMVLGADQLSRSITSATWHAMLADRRDAAYEMMQTIGQKQGIEAIRIFNKEGRVTFSTDPDAPRQVDKNAEACFLCHKREAPLSRVDVPYRARVFQGGDGTRQLGFVTPIYNEPACSNAACHAHPASKTVLGVLDIQLDLEPVDRDIAELQARAAATTTTEIVLIGLFIVFFTRRFVGMPLRRLTRATEAMAEMELDRPVPIEGEGDLGRLARSFERMRVQLKGALDALEGSAQELERKVEERSRQLSAAQKKLIHSDRLASLGQLAASVAHEINNPISGVLNLSMLMERIMKDGGVPPGREAEFRDYLSQISEETARVGRIVSDLLSFSRRSAPTSAQADLNKVVQNTVSLLGHKLELGRVALELELDPQLPEIPCDRSQIQQVVMNLVMNGAEAMGEGGRLQVRTRLEAGGAFAVLEVVDSGPGIPENLRSRVFDPFFTTKEEGKGVGLGLAVVYGIVEAHGGTIEVESVEGEGTTFVVRLPLTRPEPAALPAAQAPTGT